jgi:hypothetical protein
VLLESCHARAVSDRRRSATFRQFADAAVGKREQSYHHQLPRNRSDCAPQTGCKSVPHVLPSLGSGDGTVIGADAHLVSEEVLIGLFVVDRPLRGAAYDHVVSRLPHRCIRRFGVRVSRSSACLDTCGFPERWIRGRADADLIRTGEHECWPREVAS